MRYLKLLLVLLALGGLPTATIAYHGSKEEAVALVQRALQHIQQVGLDQALADFKQPGNPFQDHDLYVFVYDFQGNNLANSIPIKLPAVNLRDVRSADGKLVIQQMIEMSKASGGGAFQYDWINPETNQVQSKISYFKRIPGVEAFLGCGYYKEPAVKELGPKQKAVQLLHKALEHIGQVGLKQALKDFKQPDNPFRDQELYVFVYDFEGNNLANTVPLNLPGANLKDWRSPDGKLVIQQMIEMSKRSGGGAFEYDWTNPKTKAVQSKISYFRRIPDFEGFIGCGYYQP